MKGLRPFVEEGLDVNALLEISPVYEGIKTFHYVRIHPPDMVRN